MNCHTLALLSLAILSVAFAGKPKAAGQFTTAPQCKCKDIVECAHDLLEKTNKCKTSAQCEPFIKKIGNSGKIRACLEKEQKEMEKLEKCVEKKVGPVGCTNDEHPKNLTIPMMPQMDQAAMEAQAAQQPQQPGQAPQEMGQYLMCVDQCAMTALEKEAKGHRQRRSPMNCANKLRSVPMCKKLTSKTLTKMQYKNSPDKMELTLNFRTGEHPTNDIPLESKEEGDEARHDPRFPLLSDHNDPDSNTHKKQMLAPFKRAKPPFYLKKDRHKHGHKKHHNHGRNHHPTHHPPPIIVYESPHLPLQQFMYHIDNPMLYGSYGSLSPQLSQSAQLSHQTPHSPYLGLVGKRSIFYGKN